MAESVTENRRYIWFSLHFFPAKTRDRKELSATYWKSKQTNLYKWEMRHWKKWRFSLTKVVLVLASQPVNAMPDLIVLYITIYILLCTHRAKVKEAFTYHLYKHHGNCILELVRQSQIVQSVIDSSGTVVPYWVITHLCSVHFRFVSTLVVY